jgi:hypothetical protein
MKSMLTRKSAPGSAVSLSAQSRRTRTTHSNPVRTAARIEVRHDSQPAPGRTSTLSRNSNVSQALNSPGQPLSPNLRPAMESQFGFDFSKVRVHTDARAADSADSLNASAYTVGTHIVFAAGQFNPSSSTGRALLAHELTHVAQQRGQNSATNGFHSLDTSPNSPHEVEADRSANSVSWRSNSSPITQTTPGTLQRKIDMRDVGKGEQSGFARVPELVTRLNGASTGLVFALSGSDLTYTVKPGGKLSNFDTQMQGFIDQAAVLPLRFTNKNGLLGNKTEGFHEGVTEDAWSSGYVDIDDLLASSDLGMESVLVHFLRERTETKNYAKRIGSESLVTGDDTPEHIAHQAEFDRAHAKGIQAELQLLQDFFSDPTIKIVPGAESGEVFRVYRNSRKDIIRTRVRPGKGKNTGVDPVTIEVVTTKDKKVHTPEEYLEILAAAPPPAAAAVGHAPNPPP